MLLTTSQFRTNYSLQEIKPSFRTILLPTIRRVEILLLGMIWRARVARIMSSNS